MARLTTQRSLTARTADYVLEGGGVKGIALVGALKAFEEKGYSPNRIAGTSAGAVVGAAYAAGARAPELHTLLVKTKFSQFTDPTLLERLPVPFVNTVLSEIVDKGEYKGSKLEDFFAALLEKHGVSAFADLKLADPGMDPNVPLEQRYKFVAVVADATRGEEARFPWDYDARYGLPRDQQSVARALHMSSAIPFFFVPVPLQSQITGETSLMVDGGVTNGFPVGIFDRTDGVAPRWPTFNISLSSRQAADRKVGEIGGVLDYGQRLFTTLLEGRSREEVSRGDRLRRTVFIDTSFVDATDFNVDPATAERLFQSGYDAAKGFLKTFSFGQYQRDAALRNALRQGVPLTAPPATGVSGPGG